MTNLENIALVIIVTPMAAALGMSFFFIIDNWFKNYKWYGRILYGGGERDGDCADEFFGKTFLGIGVVNVLLPFIVIFSYLHITGKPISDLWLGK